MSSLPAEKAIYIAGAGGHGRDFGNVVGADGEDDGVRGDMALARLDQEPFVSPGHARDGDAFPDRHTGPPCKGLDIGDDLLARHETVRL